MKRIAGFLFICLCFFASRVGATIISGNTSVCVGASATYTIDTTGGTWSSSNTSVATVNAGTGAIAGIMAGTALISYNLPGVSFTKLITVNAQPPAITGLAQICEGSYTTISNSMSTAGTWISSAPSIASIVSNGKITGVTGGIATITYKLTATGCFVTREQTINALPADIVNPTALCPGGTTTLTSSPAGGTWNSSNASVASIDISSGLTTAVSGGYSGYYLALITYTLPTGCLKITQVTVNSAPGPVIGALTICSGTSTTLNSGTTGGIWTSSVPAVASVGLDGTLTGLTTGTTEISYTMGAGCASSAIVTVTPGAGANIGDNIVCIGQSTTLSNAITGGTWTSSTPSKASVHATTGVVTGYNTGTANITYTAGPGCNSITQVSVVGSAAITGGNKVCVGDTKTLSYSIIGGTWSSSNTSKATIDVLTGDVTGISTGTAVITYTLNAGCYKTLAISVGTPPAAIAGVAQGCVGSLTTLSNPSGGGTWTSNNISIARIASNGKVTAVSGGVATISYNVATTGCTATREFTVNVVPDVIANPGTICPGTSVTLVTSPAGGTWSSSNNSVASVESATGIVTGTWGSATSTSAAIITYAMPTGCQRVIQITVNKQPASINGNLSLCVNGTSALTCPSTGGTWSSSSPSVATISATGVVTGTGTGDATITYTLGTGCTQLATVSVNALLPANTGNELLCKGLTATFTNDATGGTWSSNNPTKASVHSTTGLVSAVNVGTAVITYNKGGGCFSTTLVTINNTLTAIAGTLSVCESGTTLLSHETEGGTWSSNNTGAATIDVTSGTATGISTGYATITYALNSSCYKTALLAVNPVPVVTATTTVLCPTETTNFSGSPVGGTWSSNNTAAVTAGLSNGLITGIAGGLTTITYELGTGCTALTAVSVNPATVAGTVTGTDHLWIDSSTTLTDTVLGGEWSSSDTLIATVTPGSPGSALVTGISAGTVIISYVTTGMCGDAAATKTITVEQHPSCFEWVTEGGAGFSTGSAVYTSLALDNSELPYIVFTDGATGSKATVRHYDGSAWSTVGIQGFSEGATAYTSIALNNSGIPYVTFRDAAHGNKASVMYYAGDTWQYAGTAGFSEGAVYFTSIAIDATGTPYVVYVDVVNDNKISVMKYTGTEWISVGTAGISSGTSSDPSIAINSAGIPYIAYYDASLDYKAVVMKYVSGSWTAVGTPGFTTGIADYISLKIDGAGTPYIAFRDFGHGTKATVMKYTGSDWVNVGEPGFSAGQPFYNSLALDASGTPYLAYADVSNGGKASVMKYESGTWLHLGEDGISAGTASHTCLAIGASNTPYLAYGDGASVTGTLIKYVGVVAPITGTLTVATGETTTLYDAEPGGTWVSTMPEVATINAAGEATGISPGTVVISYLSGDCAATKVLTVTATAGRGVAAQETGKDFAGTGMLLYPSPTSGNLTLDTRVAGNAVITSMDGRVVMQLHVEEGTNKIAMPANLAAGVYLLQFTGIKGERAVLRFVLRP
jgi:trimeric autotransporter adhesin